jgi:hypothetical protein
VDQHVDGSFEMLEEVVELVWAREVATLPVGHGDAAGLHELAHAALEPVLVSKGDSCPRLVQLTGDSPRQRLFAGDPKDDGMATG